MSIYSAEYVQLILYIIARNIKMIKVCLNCNLPLLSFSQWFSTSGKNRKVNIVYRPMLLVWSHFSPHSLSLTLLQSLWLPTCSLNILGKCAFFFLFRLPEWSTHVDRAHSLISLRSQWNFLWSLYLKLKFSQSTMYLSSLL